MRPPLKLMRAGRKACSANTVISHPTRYALPALATTEDNTIATFYQLTKRDFYEIVHKALQPMDKVREWTFGGYDLACFANR